MRITRMVSRIPTSNDVLVAAGIWFAPRHFGGGGSNPVMVKSFHGPLVQLVAQGTVLPHMRVRVSRGPLKTIPQ
jgi:hypothetical protein